ncbi:MAG: DUF4064 domain-containing protein [Firmicutes bacterium]|nr:DUF4064 domain-containing protein [Bacillota bacterium]
MAKKRGTSNVPMIMGIIGGVLGLPGAVCAGACAEGLSAVADEAGTGVGDFYLWMGLIGALLGFVFGLMAKGKPMLSGVMMIVAALMCGITMIIGNLIALVVAILFLIGGIFALVQKKEEVAA